MSRRRSLESLGWVAAAWSAAALFVPGTAQCQQRNTPHAAYVYPAGGQQGTTFEVSVGGQFLDETAAAFVSGQGVRARVVGFVRPLNPRELNDLRDRLQELRKQANPATRREMTELAERLRDTQKRNANPSMSQNVKLEISIAPDAEPGERRLRLSAQLGLTNPLVFCVGQLREFREDVEAVPRGAVISLPAVVNGRVIPGDPEQSQFPLRQDPRLLRGDADRYRFQAHRGQQLVAAVAARELIPYLADAVPGWFQAVITLYDAGGREVAYDDDYQFHPDPVIHYEIPADGDYVLEIRDALYRGRDDFVYRISIGELPYITSIFPLGVPLGRRSSVEVRGWNLPAGPIGVNATSGPAGIRRLSVRSANLVSNSMPLAVDSLPEVTEREPNDSLRNAQPVTLPVIVDGRIQQPGDRDVFTFVGRAGDQVVAEVGARRLDSPLDSELELLDSGGSRIAFNDDAEDKGSGLLTHHADSRLSATLPGAGAYYIRLGDVQHKGGAEYAYRLRLSPPRPDFDLRIAPSAIDVSGSGTVPITVYAIRRDGFAGEIVLALADPAHGFSMSGGLIPAGQDQVHLTVTAPPATAPELVTLSVEGGALINGRRVVRQAVPADDEMQAFAYHHLVVADALLASVTTRGATRVPVRIEEPRAARVRPGGTVFVWVSLPPAYARFQNLQIELSEPQEGISVERLTVEPGGAGFTIRADAQKVKPGTRINIITELWGERPVQQGQNAPAANRRIQLTTVPAIPLEILASR